MKTSELIGTGLDFWVCKALGINAAIIAGELWVDGRDLGMTVPMFGSFSPSTDWAQGGPIIEAKCIELVTFGNPGQWSADPPFMSSCWNEYNHINVGPTPLIAAMRALVREKFGDEVTP